MHPFAQLTLTRRAALLSAAAFPLFGLTARGRLPSADDKGWRKTYGLSSFGDLNLPENFANFPYAKPGAPRGGVLSMEAVATSYNSLNGFILQGNPATGLSLINDSLMAGSLDEDNALYGLVARSGRDFPGQAQLSLPSAARGAVPRPFADARAGTSCFRSSPCATKGIR